MNGNTFVDTNILVYSRDASEPEKNAIAFTVLQELWESQTGIISIQVCNEYYVTVTQKLDPGLSPDEAWDDVIMYESWKPVPIDMKTLHKAKEAQQLYQLSWRDSLIAASAFIANCSRIISEDMNHGQEYFGITVENPFNGKLPEPQHAE